MMKPAWDRLTKDFAKSTIALVGEVDCTTLGGNRLCNKLDVSGYPTMKWGDPKVLTDYKGSRDYQALYLFALNNLGASCGAVNTDLCSEEERKKIEGMKAMGIEKLEEKIRKVDMAVIDAEDALDEEIATLQVRQDELLKDMDEAITALNEDMDLDLMKSVWFFLEHEARSNPNQFTHDEL